eukprot:PhF_6_TR6950/c0_g1_i2/m.10212
MKTRRLMVWVLVLSSVFMITRMIVWTTTTTTTTATASSSIPPKIPSTRRGSPLGETTTQKPLTDTPSPSTTTSTPARLVKITKQSELKQHPFVFIQHMRSGMYLARPLTSTTKQATAKEKTWYIKFNKDFNSYTIKSHFNTYMSCELNDKISVDRPQAKSFEQFIFRFDAKGAAQIESRRSGRLLSTFRDGRSLHAIESFPSDDPDTYWNVAVAPHCDSQETCFGPGKSSSKERNDDDDDGVDDIKLMNLSIVPLCSSPKPIRSPGRESSPTDVVVKRAWGCWSQIKSLQPVVFAEDFHTAATAKSIAPTIHIETQFEKHTDPRFQQPTYRGLFLKTFQRYANAEVVVYSNSDVLYNQGLMETIRVVSRFYQQQVTQGGAKWRGFMIVGQRTNVDVPNGFECTGNPEWGKLITKWGNEGELFQTDAEDYFIVSKGMFDWGKEIPDFVVGGVAFDNWIVSKANRIAKSDQAMVVDATKTITAVHQNHGVDIKDSHNHPKSAYNRELGERHGGWSGGRTSDAAFTTQRTPEGKVTVFDKHRLLFL